MTKRKSSNRVIRHASRPPTKRSQRGKAIGKPADSGSTKHAKLIAMLQDFGGATIAAMAKATGWQPHSVRGFLAGVVRKKLKLNLLSEIKDGQDRIYRIVDRKDAKSSSSGSIQAA